MNEDKTTNINQGQFNPIWAQKLLDEDPKNLCFHNGTLMTKNKKKTLLSNVKPTTKKQRSSQKNNSESNDEDLTDDNDAKTIDYLKELATINQNLSTENQILKQQISTMEIDFNCNIAENKKSFVQQNDKIEELNNTIKELELKINMLTNNIEVNMASNRNANSQQNKKKVDFPPLFTKNSKTKINNDDRRATNVLEHNTNTPSSSHQSRLSFLDIQDTDMPLQDNQQDDQIAPDPQKPPPIHVHNTSPDITLRLIKDNLALNGNYFSKRVSAKKHTI